MAYVFLYILPELASHHRNVAEESGTSEALAENLVHAVALAGLVVFYGLERAIKVVRKAGKGTTGASVFWVHIASLAVYNVIIGYPLLHREEPGLWFLLIYGLAMSLHFLTNDFSLRQDHEARYDHRVWWIIAGAVLGSCLIGVLMMLPEIAVALLFAFLTGVLLNILKEELPEERGSRFLPFLLGRAVSQRCWQPFEPRAVSEGSGLSGGRG